MESKKKLKTKILLYFRGHEINLFDIYLVIPLIMPVFETVIGAGCGFFIKVWANVLARQRYLKRKIFQPR